MINVLSGTKKYPILHFMIYRVGHREKKLTFKGKHINQFQADAS